MANNINREGFKRFLELGAPSFEGNIILDSGELSEYYYRFMRIPLAYGEHKVDVLYGQRFYGCLLYTSPSPRDRQKSRMPSSA